MTKKRKEISFVEQMRLLHRAGLTHKGIAVPPSAKDYEDMEALSMRIKKILEITERYHLTPSKMLFFVMYDIENNKVRTLLRDCDEIN